MAVAMVVARRRTKFEESKKYIIEVTVNQSLWQTLGIERIRKGQIGT